VSAWGFTSLDDMTITADESGSTHIAFDDNDSVTLAGLGDPLTLLQSDFIFA
jgi:hypothetical protein